jgi:hypothetical protein
MIELAMPGRPILSLVEEDRSAEGVPHGRDRSIADRGEAGWGRIGAADRRNPGDSEGEQETMNAEVIGRFAAIHLGCERPGVRFHTAEATAQEFGVKAR